MKKISLFVFVMLFLVCSFFFINSIYVYIIVLTISGVYLYILSREYYLEKQEKKFIQKHLQTAKANIFNTPNVIIMIVKDLKVVWGNDQAYEEFPKLYKDRNMKFLLENEVENLLKYNNKIYNILEKGTVYFLINITQNYRQENKLKNTQTIIGFFQIDNFSSLEATMSVEEHMTFTTDFKKDIFLFFSENKIYFQEINKNFFYLNIPYFYIVQGVENRFMELGQIIKKYHEQNIGVSTTMGIAYNYDNVRDTGRKAREALELAISRGGAQIVVFDNQSKKYFGGGITETKGSTRLRARIVGNTLLRLVEQNSSIYLITHKNPDSDAIASLLLMYKFLKKDENNVKIILDNPDIIEKYELEQLEFLDDIIINYVLDKTKQNILISLDTQSKDIISHTQIIEEVEDIIVIDHHQTPKNYFRGNIFSWIEPNASSTVELIMSIIIGTNNRSKNKFINDLAIEGILTDTNKFRYRTGAQTLESLMHLVELGGDFNQALQKMYLDRKMFLKKQNMINNLIFMGNFSVVQTNETDDILMSIVGDEILELKGICGSIVIAKSEEVDKFKVKIRTNNKISAKKIIEEFNGGGHARQAAGVLNEDEKNKLLKKIMEIKGE